MVIAQLIYINVIKGQAECSRIFFAVGKNGETLKFYLLTLNTFFKCDVFEFSDNGCSERN